MSKIDLRHKLSAEGLNVVPTKKYYYVKGYIREEKVKKYDIEDVNPIQIVKVENLNLYKL